MLWLLLVLPPALLLGGVLYQWAGERRDRRNHPAPGRMVGGLHVYETGKQGPSILLEAGISASSLSWRIVQERLAGEAHVTSYDRAGYGWSPAAGTPRTIENLLGELHSVVMSRATPGPVVLVGHSFGGLLLRHYAAWHTEHVAALVLVDPLEPMEWSPVSPERLYRLGKGVMLSRRGAMLARFGVVRLALDLLMSGSQAIPKMLSKATSGRGSSVTDRLVGEVRKMPAAVWPMVKAHWCLPRSFLTMAEYLERLPETCRLPVDSEPSCEIPLVVISAEKSEPEVIEAHRRTAACSKRGVHIVAAGSGHWVQLDCPEVVIEAIRRVS